MKSVSPAYITISLLRWTLGPISPHWHVCFQAFCLITSSLSFSSVSERLVWMQAETLPASSWHLMTVHDDDHQDHEIWEKVMTPLLEINTAVQKPLHWFAPDLKVKSANIEISISDWLGHRAPGSYEARKRSTNILYSLKVISYCTKMGLRHCSPFLISVVHLMNHWAAHSSRNMAKCRGGIEMYSCFSKSKHFPFTLWGSLHWAQDTTCAGGKTAKTSSNDHRQQPRQDRNLKRDISEENMRECPNVYHLGHF